VLFKAAELYVQSSVFQNASCSAPDMTFSDSDEAYFRSVALFDVINGNDSSKLARFKGLGKKMLTLHGTGDPLVPLNGTVQ